MFNESNFVLGSDQEKALINAMKSVFPEVTRFLCVFHIQKNIREHLKKLAVRNFEFTIIKKYINIHFNNFIKHIIILKQIDEITATDISKFIYNELIKAKSIADYDSADMLLCEQLKEHQHVSRFLAYYEQNVRPILKTQLTTGLRVGFASGANWTNNNAESKNKIL